VVGGLGSHPLEGPNPARRDPVLSAVQFSHSVDTSDGATMNVTSGEVLSKGKPGYVVAGTSDIKGNKVPTHEEPHPMGLDTIMAHRRRIRKLAVSTPEQKKDVALGSWRDPDRKNAPNEIDAAGMFTDRREAIRVGRVRGEKAIYDNANEKDIKLRKPRPPRKKKS
jgi:hypothetical protein